MSTKSRNIPITTFLEELQIEYFLNELRSKIYPSRKDREYYKKVSSFKKAKIDDIVTKNKLPSIFNDPAIHREFRSRVYLDHGPPNLLRISELALYYKIGEHVKVKLEDDIKTGVIDSVNFDSNVVGVVLKGKNKPIFSPIKRTTRIF